jgi:hypothetical protein
MFRVFPVKSGALLALAPALGDGVDSDVARGAWHAAATRSATNVIDRSGSARLM